MGFPVRRRRMAAAVAACLCGLACAFGTGLAPGTAVAAQLGTFQFGRWCAGAGQTNDPVGVAVNNDPSSSFYGDVYVADSGNNRLDRFNASGSFQLAWGWGVANGGNELQTACTVACQRGYAEEQNPPQPVNTGAVIFPSGVAVDSNPLSSSAGDVYVVEAGDIERVESLVRPENSC